MVRESTHFYNDYNLLFVKLKNFPIHSKLYNILLNFLNDRSQFVLIGSSNSESLQITSGVPQGTILGPLLYSAYINDLFTSSFLFSSMINFNSNIRCRCFRWWPKLTDVPGPELQRVKLIEDWSISNLMDINIDKCAVISRRGKSYALVNFILYF